MFVYLVKYMEQYEVNQELGIFGDYDKAKAYVDKYEKENKLYGGWLCIMKVELDKEYGWCLGGVGEEM